MDPGAAAALLACLLFLPERENRPREVTWRTRPRYAIVQRILCVVIWEMPRALASNASLLVAFALFLIAARLII